MTSKVLAVLIACALMAGASACEKAPSGSLTAPTPIVSTGPENTTLKVSAPAMQSPVSDEKLTSEEVVLSAGSASLQNQTPTPVALEYRFQVFDAAGTTIANELVGGPAYTVTAALTYSTRYTWRVRAEAQGEPGPWSATGAFVTKDPPPPPKPANPCAHTFDPNDIIACWIANLWDDAVGHGEMHALMTAVAKDFNRAEIPGGPFGILVKAHGNNCEGYSCDIVCAGQGDDQDQYDILLDERIANFGGAMNGPGIRVDVCEIQYWDD